ncbi:hypothetical protein CCUG60884_00291 [Mycobacteroides salmoniphilum]|uniref:Uncharacterized protein n=1 Tax=Mycobacteroides salmoniphilum TaxID=404941 RepID=A0A4R8SZU1_9MYCO|nr:hypothetical protein CCUG60884_00291 [Mycobacteroides salmoniphilum]
MLLLSHNNGKLAASASASVQNGFEMFGGKTVFDLAWQMRFLKSAAGVDAPAPAPSPRATGASTRPLLAAESLGSRILRPPGRICES